MGLRCCPSPSRSALSYPFSRSGLAPVLADVASACQHFAMPQKTTLDLIWHSGLDVMTAAVGGWARLLLDLAKDSLSR